MCRRCPGCWNPNVSRVGATASGRRPNLPGQLMECGECESWFWAETGEKVVRLFEICTSALVDPGRCLPEVREVLNSGGNGVPRCRIGEFNRLCSDCMSGRITARRSAALFGARGQDSRGRARVSNPDRPGRPFSPPVLPVA